ncbi:alpha-arabinosides ABC transport system, permease protein AraN [Melissococcus plutonius ATCC 35311]|uniref:Alpha-arabinosides ABC transport system, permease protein AraN n=1 Tax=Melissococcus plutonius (strain ATCC 35311 / DSM 29964 / CIP 104052 / LMG 20360 / NCIMB 702443) TaxID=940190 RepID=F3YAC1_MELPT|nr:extracellular solute-binding protein [Melissococcus plutonius]MBB5176788.1 lactose/L-arabinose transport system substrate-binding protein [Melissococcus plutonius]BAK21449.1 alpha-arabinosides ABC transport system, permease protein AraN [Melissococcus plutonius ATCC 35311]
MKRICFVIFSLTAGFLLLVGCGNSNSKVSKEEENKVTVWAWDETFNVEAMNQAKKMYKNKDVTIDIVTMSQDDIVQKLNTTLASGNNEGLPNIVLIEDYRIQGYLNFYPDAFADLTDIVKEKDFAAYKFAVNKVGNKIYGVPFDSGVTTNFYRTDLLKKAGYNEEDMNHLTWDDYLQVARDIKKKTGKKITEVNPSDLGRIRIIMQEAGEWYTAKDGKTATIKNNKSLKYGLELFATLLKEDLVEQTSDWNAGVSAVQSGKVASSPTGSTIQGAKKQSGKWKIAPIPALPKKMQKAQASNLGSGGWYVMKNIPGEKNAKDFLKKTFATNKKLMETLTKKIGLVPTMLGTSDQAIYKEPSKFYSNQKVFEDFSKWTAKIPEVNYGEQTYAIESVVGEALRRIVDGENTDKVLADTQTQIESQLAN